MEEGQATSDVLLYIYIFLCNFACKRKIHDACQGHGLREKGFSPLECEARWQQLLCVFCLEKNETSWFGNKDGASRIQETLQTNDEDAEDNGRMMAFVQEKAIRPRKETPVAKVSSEPKGDHAQSKTPGSCVLWVKERREEGEQKGDILYGDIIIW